MLAKMILMTSKLVAKPLAEMLVKVMLLIAKVDGETSCRYAGEGIDDDVEIGGETPCR